MFHRYPNLKLLSLLVFAVWATMASYDLYTPCLPVMAKYYATSDDWLNLTVTASIICFPLVGIFWGPLSDAYGRRRIFIVGMGLFVIGSFLCAAIPPLPIMIAGRFIQGLGTCVADILVLAIISDLFKGDQSAKMMSTLELFMVLSPTVAPILGGIISKYFGWQYNFYLIAATAFASLASVYFYLPESLPYSKRQPFRLQSLKTGYLTILRNPTFMLYACVTSMIFAGLFVVLVGLPYLYEDVYGYSLAGFTVIMAIGATAYFVGAELNRRFVERFGTARIFAWGVGGFGFSSFLILVSAYLPTDGYLMNPEMAPYTVRAVTCLYIFFMGLTFANGAAITLGLFPTQTGTASAALIALEMLAAAVAITLTGYFYHDSYLPLAWLMVAFGGAALVINWFIPPYNKSDPAELRGRGL